MPANRIVYECLDAAFSRFDFVDKKTFYDLLTQKYHVESDKFADNFEVVHQALKDVFGVNHYKIEREVIHILNDRAKDGTYDRYIEVSAFGRMVNVFMKETESNIKRNKSLAVMTNYAHNLEQEVKDANEKLQSAQRLAAIGETAAMVGHDIRNPLQAIVGEIYLEKTDIAELPEGPIKKSLQDSIKAIEDNLFYINKIVSDLQDFAKPVQLEETEKIDISAIIGEVLSMIPIPKNLEVSIYVENNFPLFHANHQIIKRTLMNLIQNAIQAMAKGGKLTIRAEVADQKAVLSVQDTGDGIPESVKANLFKPLFTTKAKGQGLGLAVVKRLVEAYGGSVGFESEQGNGAKFIIKLPLSLAPD